MKKRINPVNLEEIWHLILEDQVFVLQKDRETCVLAPRILRSCMNPDQIKKHPVSITRQADGSLLFTDVSHHILLSREELKTWNAYESTWIPNDPNQVLSCIPCRNCGRC